MKSSKIALVLVVLVVLIGGGVWWAMRGDDDDTPATTTNQTETTDQTTAPIDENTPVDESTDDPAPGNASVEIKDFSFGPSNLTIKKGTTVTWTNQGSTMHTVTSDEGDTLNSGELNKGDSYVFTFNEAGTFDYHCTPHPQMTGTVTVTE